MQLNKLVIDSSDCTTDLCLLGAYWGTDKSPINIDPALHKHPYTAVYDFLFSSMRYENMNFAEIGILKNKSMRCWRNYFPNANLYGFEWFEERINAARLDNLDNTFYYRMNVEDENSIDNAFAETKKLYKVIIDDSTHVFIDQINIINIGYKYLLPGGILIIEDIFRDADESVYKEYLKPVSKYFSSVTFVITEHSLKWSPEWNNDKLLVLYRNDIK